MMFFLIEWVNKKSYLGFFVVNMFINESIQSMNIVFF